MQVLGVKHLALRGAPNAQNPRKKRLRPVLFIFEPFDARPAKAVAVRPLLKPKDL
jgi:hypothetical protein